MLELLHARREAARLGLRRGAVGARRRRLLLGLVRARRLAGGGGAVRARLVLRRAEARLELLVDDGGIEHLASETRQQQARGGRDARDGDNVCVCVRFRARAIVSLWV